MLPDQSDVSGMNKPRVKIINLLCGQSYIKIRISKSQFLSLHLYKEKPETVLNYAQNSTVNLASI